MINSFKMELAKDAEAPTHEDFINFMVKKHFFTRSGHHVQKMYVIGNNSLRDGLFLKIQYDPVTGVFAEWQLFEQGAKNLWVEPSGRSTRPLKEMFKWSEQMKDAAIRLESDLKALEAFVKG